MIFPNTAQATVRIGGVEHTFSVTENDSQEMYRALLEVPLLSFSMEWPEKELFAVCKHLDPSIWKSMKEQMERLHG